MRSSRCGWPCVRGPCRTLGALMPTFSLPSPFGKGYYPMLMEDIFGQTVKHQLEECGQEDKCGPNLFVRYFPTLLGLRITYRETCLIDVLTSSVLKRLNFFGLVFPLKRTKTETF